MENYTKQLSRFIGEIIRTKRDSKGITQETLAGRSGVGYKYIGKIEQGRYNITMTTLFKLAEGLEIEPSEIVDEAKLRLEADHKK